MSKKHDYIEGTKGERLADGKVFTDQLAIDGITFGLTVLEIGDSTTKYGTFKTNSENGDTLDALKQEQTKNTNLADDAFIKSERILAGKMKKSSLYTEAVGKRYKIIGGSFDINPTTAKPIIEVTKAPTGYSISFDLLGFFDGVEIFRQRPGEPAPVYLKTRKHDAYVDTDKMVDGTEYTAFFLIGDDAVGVVSKAVKIQL